MDESKKHLQKGEDSYPPLGNFVNWYIQEMKLKKKTIADELHILPTTLNNYFKKNLCNLVFCGDLAKL